MAKGLERKIEQYSFGRLNNEHGKNMTEYQQTMVILNSLQNFLDNTETPSQALDNLYISIVESIKAINHEMENQEND